MKYLKYLFVVGLLAFCFNADAQYYEEVIYLKDGSVIRGDVLEQNSETIKIEVAGGTILIYKMEEIDKIIKEEKNLKEREIPQDYRIKDNGYYHTINFGLLPGSGGQGGFAFGGSLHYSFGYQYKRLLGAGIGVGADSYIDSEIRTIIPIYLEGRGYIIDKPFSPYYVVQAGYGFALVNDTWNMTEATGGIMIHPKIGFRFPSRSNASFTTEIGYLIQKANFVFDGWDSRYEDDVLFKRISIRFGILF